ncbi:hypothetical protein N7451_012913 [Penicillium sp. IBT 35674x]|nr:hypothetical protein N7451_012913 [Penicillium sp. IBT 35674x]
MAPGGHSFSCSWEHCGKVHDTYSSLSYAIPLAFANHHKDLNINTAQSFNRKSDLCRHYRIHTNERPYHCTLKGCNKSFIQRSALTVHSRTHTGEKPHVCGHEGCQKAFSDSSSLARHQRTHSSKRPYICQEPTCERSFCRKTTLTKHEHRCHPPSSTPLPSSEDVKSEQSHHQHQPPVSVPTSDPNYQYLLAQHSYYRHLATPYLHLYPPFNDQIGSVLVHEGVQPIVPHNVPATSPINMTYAPLRSPPHPHQKEHSQRQQYLHMQHRSDSFPHMDYLQPKCHQPPFQGHQLPERQLMMIGYHPNFQTSGRTLNQLEGAEWAFQAVD